MMRVKIFLALATLAAAAASCKKTIFNVVTHHPGSGPGHALDATAWAAAENSVFALLRDQNATCEHGRPDHGRATFRLNPDTSLDLYSTLSPAKTQTLFVDRSGMGQGKIGFTSGAESGPRYGEHKGWAVDADGRLTFAGAGFLACPGYLGGAWEIWLAGVSDHPGFNYNCSAIGTQVVAVHEPVSCRYQE